MKTHTSFSASKLSKTLSARTSSTYRESFEFFGPKLVAPTGPTGSEANDDDVCLQKDRTLMILFENVLVESPKKETLESQEKSTSRQKMVPSLSKRAGFEEFFQILAPYYNIVVLTDISAQVVMKILKQEKVLEHVFAIYSNRNSKDRISSAPEDRFWHDMGLDLNTTTFITAKDRANKQFPFQVSNLVVLDPFNNDPYDQMLFDLTSFLEFEALLEYKTKKDQDLGESAIQEKFMEYLTKENVRIKSLDSDAQTPYFDVTESIISPGDEEDSNPIPTMIGKYVGFPKFKSYDRRFNTDIFPEANVKGPFETDDRRTTEALRLNLTARDSTGARNNILAFCVS